MADSYREALVGCLVTLRALRVHCPPTINIRHLEIAIWIFLQPGITRKDLSRLLPELSEPSLRKYISDLQKTSWRDSYGGAENDGRTRTCRRAAASQSRMRQKRDLERPQTSRL